MRVLSALPLPLGYKGISLAGRIRTCNPSLPKRALHQVKLQLDIRVLWNCPALSGFSAVWCTPRASHRTCADLCSLQNNCIAIYASEAFVRVSPRIRTSLTSLKHHSLIGFSAIGITGKRSRPRRTRMLLFRPSQMPGITPVCYYMEYRFSNVLSTGFEPVVFRLRGDCIYHFATKACEVSFIRVSPQSSRCPFNLSYRQEGVCVVKGTILRPSRFQLDALHLS